MVSFSHITVPLWLELEDLHSPCREMQVFASYVTSLFDRKDAADVLFVWSHCYYEPHPIGGLALGLLSRGFIIWMQDRKRERSASGSLKWTPDLGPVD